MVRSSAVEAICAAIADEGYAVVDEFLQPKAIAALAADARQRDSAAEFHPAGVGRGAARSEHPDIRGDRICWLEPSDPRVELRPWWLALSALRAALNQALFLGLWSFEGHYAAYSAGSFYRRHRDRFQDHDARVLSCVLYLNQSWSTSDGGALRLYRDAGALDVPPRGGTLVCFLADRFEHEVLPATRERLALTGWLLRRESEGAC
jgi:SM-20-related protein